MLSTVRRAMALFDPATQRRFFIATAGSVLLALAEVGSVILVLPLMQLILNQPAGNNILLRLKQLFGFPPASTLATYIAAMVFFGFLFKGVAAIAIRWWTLGFINTQGVRSAQELLGYYLRAPMSLHVRRGTADLLRMLNDALGSVYGQVIAGTMNIVTEGITIVAMTVTLLALAPLPTLAVVAYFGIAGLTLQRVIRKHAIKAGQDLIQNSYLTGQTALQALGGIKEIKVRNDQDLFVNRYGDARLKVAYAHRRSAFLEGLPRFALELLFILGVGIMTAIAYAQTRSAAALSTLAIFAVAGFRVLPSTVRLIASLNVLRVGMPGLELVERDIEAARALPKPTLGKVERLPFHDTVKLDQVTFRYDDGDRDVVHDIDLTIPAGTSLALVGSSGAGKSTLVDILLGLQKPTQGRILVDGVDIADRIPEWQANLAMVPQDVYLLDASLRTNIQFTPGQDEDGQYMQEVIRLSQLEDLVTELPDGLETHVGDRGTRLSGGQRQRVGIARALYRRPSLLVLDEATSALDNLTERKITDTIEGLRGQISVVVVAHRLSTVRRCDQLAFLSAGRIEAVGTFDAVATRSPEFARLVRFGSLSSSDLPTEGREPPRE